MTNIFRLFRIARLTVLEGVRTRFFAMVALLMVMGIGLAMFAGSLALTESIQTSTLLLAGFLRLGAVFLLGLAVVTAMVREIDDKVAEIFLSLSLPRSAYYLGRLMGFCGLAWMATTLVFLPVSLLAPVGDGVMWALSLGCELSLVAGAALLFALTFRQPAVALVALAAFYLLARSLAAFQLMAGGVLYAADSLGNHAIRLLLEGLALVLPGFYHFTLGEWLVYGGSWSQLTGVVGETVVYFFLLAAAGLVDLHRKNY